MHHDADNSYTGGGGVINSILSHIYWTSYDKKLPEAKRAKVHRLKY